jgi:hypothetical protein
MPSATLTTTQVPANDVLTGQQEELNMVDAFQKSESVLKLALIFGKDTEAEDAPLTAKQETWTEVQSTSSGSLSSSSPFTNAAPPDTLLNVVEAQGVNTDNLSFIQLQTQIIALQYGPP